MSDHVATPQSEPSVVVGGIDCGTNSIRLKIARVDAHGVHDIVPRTLRVVRLGEGVDRTHRFAEEALERTYAAAREFARILDGHPVQALRFVATSATRDAQNRQEFEDTIESILGVRPEVISGVEEADLSFLAATSMTARTDLEPPFLVVDLGGGSTELVLGGDGVKAPATRVDAAFSMDIGSVRMTERHLTNDPPTQTQIDAAVDDIDAHIDEAFTHVPAGRARTIIGVSGTVTTMTALAMGLTEYDHRAVDGRAHGLRHGVRCGRSLSAHDPGGTQRIQDDSPRPHRCGGRGRLGVEPRARTHLTGRTGGSRAAHRFVCGERAWPAGRDCARFGEPIAS